MRYVRLLVLLSLPCAGAARAATLTVPGDFPTIQAALDGAPDGSEVQIAPGRYHEHLSIGNSTRSLTVRGNAADPSTVVVDGDGEAGKSVLQVLWTSNVLFEGITFTGGRGEPNIGAGGGVFVGQSDVEFHDCVFEDNEAQQGGGAFILESAGRFRDCTFRNNTVRGYGGGVMMHGGATTVFERCEVLDNTSGTTEFFGSGGGMHINDSMPTILGGRIAGNSGRGSGGGIIITGHYDQPRSVVTLRDVEIANNTTYASPGDPAAEGGGMHIEDHVKAILERCWVHDNTGHNGGGINAFRAQYDVIDSRIEDNTAEVVNGGGFGGGVNIGSVNSADNEHPAPILNFVRTAIRDNVAEVGGGMYVQGDFQGPHALKVTLDMTDCLVTGNVANNRAAGINVDRTNGTITDTFFHDNAVTQTAFGYGGGLFGFADAHTTVVDSTFAENTAGDWGGGIAVIGGGTLDVTGSHFYRNAIRNGSGGTGGAIAIGENPGPAPGPVSGTVSGSTFEADEGVGEIFESNCDLAMWSDVVYTGNHFTSPVGAIYHRNCGTSANSVGTFNGIAGKASGNVSGGGDFTTFQAVPGTIVPGGSSVIGWCVPGGSPLAIDGSPLGTRCGTVLVSPGSTTSYDLTASGNPRGDATVTVTCASGGAAVPRSPGNGSTRVPPGDVTTRWYDVLNATSYRLFLDTNPEPSTIVADGVTGTETVVSALAPSTTYRWRVAATVPGCGAPVLGPTHEFTTCATSACSFVDDFNDGDASDWSLEGKGTATVEDGALVLATRKKIRFFAPGSAVTDGTATMNLRVSPRTAEVRLLWAYQNPRAVREISIRAKAGRWKLRERAGRAAARTVAAGKRAVADERMAVAVDMQGASGRLLIDGAEALAGTFRSTGSGRFGLMLVRGTVVLDDVEVTAAGASALRR